MKTFVWGPEFFTGIGLVDDQHQRLVELFNRLANALLEPEANAETSITSAFHALTAYVREHFALEEGLMRVHHVDRRHIDLHVELHDQFSDQVHAMWMARGAIGNPAEVFLSFLTSWLCAHVLGVDQALARQIQAIQAGVAPADAYARELTRPRDPSAEAMIKALRNLYQVVARLGVDLSAANRQLEERVAARTTELRLANEALQQANRKLAVFAQTDGLLGIANRKYFDERFRDAWHRAMREREPLAVVMLDVDFFKAYNDHYGHLAGDACLQAVARAAGERVVRAVDLLARYGGEEFIVLLPNTSLGGAAKVAHDICEAVSELHLPHAHSSVAAWVTLSAGVAAWTPERDDIPTHLLEAADAALYRAKQEGRARVCLMKD